MTNHVSKARPRGRRPHHSRRPRRPLDGRRAGGRTPSSSARCPPPRPRSTSATAPPAPPPAPRPGPADKNASASRFVADGVTGTAVTVASDATDTNDGDAADVTTCHGQRHPHRHHQPGRRPAQPHQRRATPSPSTEPTKGAAQKCGADRRGRIGRPSFQFDLVRPDLRDADVRDAPHAGPGQGRHQPHRPSAAAPTRRSSRRSRAATTAPAEGHVLMPAGTVLPRYEHRAQARRQGSHAASSRRRGRRHQLRRAWPRDHRCTTGNGKKYVDLPAGRQLHARTLRGRDVEDQGRQGEAPQRSRRRPSRWTARRSVTVEEADQEEEVTNLTGLQRRECGRGRRSPCTIKLARARPSTVTRDYQRLHADL